MGEKHSMKCQSPKGFPNASVHWLHNNKLLTPKLSQIDITTNSNGESEVIFHKITWEERGAYVCVAENKERRRNSTTATITVKGNLFS